MSTELTMGGNAPLPTGLVQVNIAHSGAVADASALLLQADGKVTGDDGMVFYNLESSLAGAVQYQATKSDARQNHRQGFAIDLGRVPANVEVITLVLSLEDPTNRFNLVENLEVTANAGGQIISMRPEGDEKHNVLLLGELYRRGGAWKIRARGQGYADGLAALARDFGVNVGDDAAPTAPVADAVPATFAATQPPAAPAAPISYSKSEAVAKKRADLVKTAPSLVKNFDQATAFFDKEPGLVERLLAAHSDEVVVIDATGSMAKRYGYKWSLTKGYHRDPSVTNPEVAQILREIMGPIIHLDDDGKVPVVMFDNDDVREVAVLTAETIEQGIEAIIRAFPTFAGGTLYAPAIGKVDHVLDKLREQGRGGFAHVTFIGDGESSESDEQDAQTLFRDNVGDPTHWLFLAVGVRIALFQHFSVNPNVSHVEARTLLQHTGADLYRKLYGPKYLSWLGTFGR